MTDETETNPVADDEPVVTPEVEAEDAEDNTEADATEETDEDGQSEEEADEVEEVEYEGAKYKVPKPLKSALMMQADYTRKTQELAETRKALEAKASQQAEVEQAIIDAHAEVVTLDRQLAQYQALTPEQWRAIQNEDPDAYRAHRDTFSDLKDARKEATEKLEAKKTERATEAQQVTAKRIQDGYAELPKIIPGWNATVEKEVAEFGRSMGISQDALTQSVAEPLNIKLLHLAMHGAKALEAKAKAAKLAKGQKTQPAHTLRGNSGKFAPAADTSDFAAFEKMADEKLKKRA